MTATRVVVNGVTRTAAQPLTVDELRARYHAADDEVRRLHMLSCRGWNRDADARAIRAATRRRNDLLDQIVREA